MGCGTSSAFGTRVESCSRLNQAGRRFGAAACLAAALFSLAGTAPALAAPPQEGVTPHDCNPATDDPLHGGLPYFDIRCDQDGLATPAVKQALSQYQARIGKARDAEIASLKARIPVLDVFNEPYLGGIQWMGSTVTLLTDAAPGVDAKTVAANYIAAHPALFEIDSAELAAARMPRDYLTDHNGVHHLTFQQQIKGVDLFECVVSANVSRDGRLINIGNLMLTRPQGDFVVAPARLTDLDAIRFAASNAGVDYTQIITPKTDPEGPSQKRTWNYTSDFLQGEPVVTELIYYPITRNNIRTAWRVTVPVKGVGHIYDIFIDAQTGELLRRQDWLCWDLTPMTFRIFPSDGVAPGSPGTATPNGFQFPEVPRTLLTENPADISAFSPQGWIDSGRNDTFGNNVDAHLDLNADNVPDLPRPDGGATRTFDFPFDSTQAPTAWQNFAVTELFWRVNWYHDQLYSLGFNEAAHNFQEVNFSGQGVGGDQVAADAQDGSGTNNANFASTPTDGTSGRCQMYVFTGPTPDRDGDLDGDIVYHEMTHGTSTRLSGGLGGAYQSPGMGEGWSDAVAIMLLAQSGDDPDANYCTGGYTTYQLGAGFVNNYYFGIRRFPYSTNLNIYPLTFADIQTLTYDTTIPANQLFINNAASEVHNEGEVWCNMLLDCRAQMWHTYGFAGNRRMLQLVIDGLKLMGANPTFQAARNGILQADLVDYGAPGDTVGPDYTQLYQAFARHGLGLSSASPNGNNSVTGIIEGYDIPQYVVFSYPDGLPPTQIQPDAPFTFHVNMAPNLLTINPSTAVLHYSTNGGPDNTVPMPAIGTNQFTATLPGQPCYATVNYYISVGTSAGARTDPATAPTLTRQASVLSSVYASDNMNTDQGWTVTPGTPAATTGLWNRMVSQATMGATGQAQPGGDHTGDTGGLCWVTDGNAGAGVGSNDVDGGQTILTSPAYNLAGAPADSRITYWRWYSNNQGNQAGTQTFLVDVSVNNGATWTRAETIGPAGAGTTGGWIHASWTLASLGLTPTSQVKLRFTAQDLIGAVVEAAIDDVLIYSCTTPVSGCGSADFNCDGDVGTDADIEAFFACLAGNCPAAPCTSTADFNSDGDVGTDADIEAFFRVLAGGNC